MKVLLTTLGFPVLEEKISNQKQYFCENKFASGKGYYTNEGFVVQRGSLARKELAAHVEREIALRNQLIADGVLKESGEHFVFTRDYGFSSPSAAAFMVLGGASNGWTAWKDKTGKTLDENVRVTE